MQNSCQKQNALILGFFKGFEPSGQIFDL